MNELRERKGIRKRKILNCDLEEKAGLREPQTTVEIQENLGQPSRELPRKGYLLEKSCTGHKRPGPGTPMVLIIG